MENNCDVCEGAGELAEEGVGYGGQGTFRRAHRCDVCGGSGIFETQKEGCEMAKWVVGMNMPGHMPDSDPSECDTFEEAKACMIGDLERTLDEADPDTDEGAKEIAAIEEIIPRLKAVVMPEEIGFTIGRWHYFIAASAFEDHGSP